MPRKPDPQTLCQHHSKDGKRCQMPLAPGSPALCAFHTRSAEKRAAAESAAAQRAVSDSNDSRAKDPAETAALADALLSGAKDLSTPAAVNLFLANLLNQLAQNRISRKNAIAMAYISQLLLNSISVMHRQSKDAQAAAAQAAANEPQRIIFDMPRPCHRRHLDDPNADNPGAHHHVNGSAVAATPSRTSSHSENPHPAQPGIREEISVPTALQPAPADATAAPSSTAPTLPPAHAPAPDDPPPSTHPRTIPLPNSSELHFTNCILREPERPNTYGAPRMRASFSHCRFTSHRRRIQKQNLSRIGAGNYPSREPALPKRSLNAARPQSGESVETIYPLFACLPSRTRSKHLSRTQLGILRRREWGSIAATFAGRGTRGKTYLQS